jgi:hypothetical protein
MDGTIIDLARTRTGIAARFPSGFFVRRLKALPNHTNIAKCKNLWLNASSLLRPLWLMGNPKKTRLRLILAEVNHCFLSAFFVQG